jgi:hypothetical protein
MSRNNRFLDTWQPEDDLIGPVEYDEKGEPFRMVAGQKRYQIKGDDQRSNDLNLSINRQVASGLGPWEYLKIIAERCRE